MLETMLYTIPLPMMGIIIGGCLVAILDNKQTIAWRISVVAVMLLIVAVILSI